MSLQRKRQCFAKIAESMRLDPIDAARRVLDRSRFKKPPRWLRRMARDIIRRASGSGGTQPEDSRFSERGDKGSASPRALGLPGRQRP
jgi:hypothetical protein